MMMTPFASSCLPAAKTLTFVLLGTDWLSGGKALAFLSGHVSFSSLENRTGETPEMSCLISYLCYPADHPVPRLMYFI